MDLARGLGLPNQCAALAAVTSSNTAALDGMFFVGLGIWAFGFVVEVVADRQKTAFRADPKTLGALSAAACGRGPDIRITSAKSFCGRRRSNGLSGIGGLANIDPIRTVMGVVADDGYQWHAHARGQSQ